MCLRNTVVIDERRCFHQQHGRHGQLHVMHRDDHPGGVGEAGPRASTTFYGSFGSYI